jgi:hypothetical protein
MVKLLLEIFVKNDIDDNNYEEFKDSLNELLGLSIQWEFGSGCSAANYLSVEEVSKIVGILIGKKKIGKFILDRIVVENDFSRKSRR